jgi:hypothetical protein
MLQRRAIAALGGKMHQAEGGDKRPSVAPMPDFSSVSTSSALALAVGAPGPCSLNLAVAAIILWNTVYLGRAIDELRSRGEVLPDEILAHVAPLGWEHIAFNGDYVWPAQPLGNAFRPLRNPRAEFLDAA